MLRAGRGCFFFQCDLAHCCPGEFLLNRKQICQMIISPKYIFRKLCAESLSLPSGLDSKASSDCFSGLFNRVSVRNWSGERLLTLHPEKFNSMDWETKWLEEIEGLKRGPGVVLSKGHKIQERKSQETMAICVYDGLGCCNSIIVSLAITKGVSQGALGALAPALRRALATPIG